MLNTSLLGGACRPPAIALLALLLILDGCVTDPSQTTRFRFEALESRCGVPTIKQLTELPPLPLPTIKGNRSRGDLPLSPTSVTLATLLGLEGVLYDLAALHGDQSPNRERSVARLWRHQQVMDRISLASFDVISTVTELDCEEARADHVADGLTQLRQDKQERGLFLALVGDALIGVVAGALSLAGQATAASANAILGGALATGIGGAATIFLSVDHEFSHPRNHLAELWNAQDSSPLFPDSVWRYLTTSVDPSQASIRQQLVARWLEDGRFGDPDSEETVRRQRLLLGTGDIYGIRELRTRAEMLNHLKSAVLRMGQDLNMLMYEVMSTTSHAETAMIMEAE